MTAGIRYIKRLEMTIDLTEASFESPQLPPRFKWFPWNAFQGLARATVMHKAFRDDLDGFLFPTYRQLAACEHLISATCSSKAYEPGASFLIGREDVPASDNEIGWQIEYCAAIECIRSSKRLGSIQNVSVLPQYRKMGLGRALVIQALLAFKARGCVRVNLEATAENYVATHLYESLGFQTAQIVYSSTLVDLNRS